MEAYWSLEKSMEIVILPKSIQIELRLKKPNEMKSHKVQRILTKPNAA